MMTKTKKSETKRNQRKSTKGTEKTTTNMEKLLRLRLSGKPPNPASSGGSKSPSSAAQKRRQFVDAAPIEPIFQTLHDSSGVARLRVINVCRWKTAFKVRSLSGGVGLQISPNAGFLMPYETAALLIVTEPNCDHFQHRFEVLAMAVDDHQIRQNLTNPERFWRHLPKDPAIQEIFLVSQIEPPPTQLTDDPWLTSDLEAAAIADDSLIQWLLLAFVVSLVGLLVCMYFCGNNSSNSNTNYGNINAKV